jgi:uncharacterized protein YecT (DUF1311 family)
MVKIRSKPAVMLSVAIASSALLPLMASRLMAQDIDCQNPNGTPEINYCAQLAYEAADAELNQVYQELNSKLSATEQDKLVATEQSWIQFRDANCEFAVRSSVGGTGYEAYLNNCLEKVTRNRTEELRLQINLRP